MTYSEAAADSNSSLQWQDLPAWVFLGHNLHHQCKEVLHRCNEALVLVWERGGQNLKAECLGLHFSRYSCTFDVDWEALPCSPASAVLFHAPFPPLWFWHWIHSGWRKSFCHVQDVHIPACTAAGAPAPSAGLRWAVGSKQALFVQPSLQTAPSVLQQKHSLSLAEASPTTQPLPLPLQAQASCMRSIISLANRGKC